MAPKVGRTLRPACIGRAWLISSKQCIFIKAHTYSVKQIEGPWIQWTATETKTSVSQHLFVGIMQNTERNVFSLQSYFCFPTSEFSFKPICLPQTHVRAFIGTEIQLQIQATCRRRPNQCILIQLSQFSTTCILILWGHEAPIMINAQGCEGRQEKWRPGLQGNGTEQQLS